MEREGRGEKTLSIDVINLKTVFTCTFTFNN